MVLLLLAARGEWPEPAASVPRSASLPLPSSRRVPLALGLRDLPGEACDHRSALLSPALLLLGPTRASGARRDGLALAERDDVRDREVAPPTDPVDGRDRAFGRRAV